MASFVSSPFKTECLSAALSSSDWKHCNYSCG